MKKSIKPLVAFGVLAGTIAACGAFSASYAEAAKPTADLSVAFLSQYVWRGYQLSHNSIVIQPSMTVGYKGFGFNLWGNLDTDTNTTGEAKFNETDTTLSYDGAWNKLGYGVGYIYYGLEGTDEQEVYANVSYDTFLSPTLTIYRDFAHSLGWYVQAGVSHSVPLTEKINLDLGATASYLSYDSGEKDNYADPHDPTKAYSGFHDGVLSASVTVPVVEYISITPSIAYSFPLSSKAKDFLEKANADYGGNADSFYGGVTASFSF